MGHPRRILRAFVALATFAIVWLVASPALAGAPVCDPRGAAMFAPPPQMQDPEQSLDVVAPCDGRADDAMSGRHVVPARGAPLDLSSSQDHATTIAVVVPRVSTLGRIPAPEAASQHPPPGVRSALERPPRG